LVVDKVIPQQSREEYYIYSADIASHRQHCDDSTGGDVAWIATMVALVREREKKKREEEEEEEEEVEEEAFHPCDIHAHIHCYLYISFI
jgi:hypothetical protein